MKESIYWRYKKPVPPTDDNEDKNGAVIVTRPAERVPMINEPYVKKKKDNKRKAYFVAEHNYQVNLAKRIKKIV